MSGQLNKIADDLGKPELSKYKLFHDEIAKEAAMLWINKDDPSRGKVPFYSQLTHVQFLLDSSSAAIDALLRTKDATRTALQRAKDDEEALSSYISNIRSALSGKDCRVAQMLIP